MPMIRVAMWSGIDAGLKKNLAKGITDVIVDNVNCPVQAVTIIFDEIPKDNWVIGGQFCSDAFKENK